jgi:tripartite-type tricarboxylate transporter receptor subunit TctC
MFVFTATRRRPEMTASPQSPDPRRRRLLGRLGLAGAGLLAPAAWAQTQPGGAPIKLIVPFTPGTGIDLIARTVGPRLADRLGRAVLVDNRPGASGNLGTDAVVRANADGTTLLVSVNTLVMNRSLFPNLSFDPLKDLVPISLTSWGQLVLVASKSSGFNTAQELVAAARANPGRINYGSPGSGTPHHLAMELVKIKTGSFMTHIPYRGTSPAMTDLLGGQIDVMFLPIHVALAQIRGGRLTALAISSDKPHALLPSVPPLRQLGLGELNVDMWYGILAPKGTPAEHVARVNAELKLILDLPEVRAAFESQGMTPAHSSPEAFHKLMEDDAARWGKVVKDQGIRAD